MQENNVRGSGKHKEERHPKKQLTATNCCRPKKTSNKQMEKQGTKKKGIEEDS